MKIRYRSFKNIKAVGLWALLVSLLVSFLSCSPTGFTLESESGALSHYTFFSQAFHVITPEAQFQQPNYSENQTSISFQVEDLAGGLVQSLNPTDIRVIENGVKVSDFTLTKNSIEHKQSVDIVFGFDVTGSMSSTIEKAKTRLIDFIRKTRAQGYHTRMCLSTFGDYTVKKCNRFYNNDPEDPTTEAQVDELISEVSKLKALTGSQDPGGKDFDENPMRNIIDAAGAPWAANSQRFMILITDAGFLYSPGNSGAVGSLAPMYSEVLEALASSKMKMFAVTPDGAGYNYSFHGGEPSIVKASGGEWYRYSDLVSGKITLDTVLNKILSNLNTTFYVNYTLNSQVDNLDPSLPLTKRNIVIQLVNAVTGMVKDVVVNSNLPSGRQSDPKTFYISDKPIKADSLKVLVNDQEVKGNYKLVSQSKIEFNKPQPAGATIKVKYEYQNLKDMISFRPITFKIAPESVNRLKVYVNGYLLSDSEYEIVVLDKEKSATVFLADKVFLHDPYGIAVRKEIAVEVRF